MDSGGWRTQLTPNVRGKIVNKIMETLKKHLPFSGPEGLNELRRIAVRFEEKIFSGASSQHDYLRKISMKMLTMQTKSQNAAGSLTSLPAANNTTPLESGNLMDNNNEKPSLPKAEPAIDTIDWRTQFPPDARRRIVNKIMEALRKHLPFVARQGTNELRRISTSFEETVFNRAVNQTDYLGQISKKLLTIETKAQNAAGSSSSIPASNNSLPLDHGDWRTQMPPDSRQKNVNKIMETLKKHFPNSGEEGINELMRIAVIFEELSLNTAINQVDYFRKTSFKMHTMEEGD